MTVHFRGVSIICSEVLLKYIFICYKVLQSARNYKAMYAI